MQSAAWERRLGDLGSILESCCASYLDPDRFRRNTNNFLQTARTVTFLIQKNKSDIPNFDAWYESYVLDRWRDDEVMVWAKDSRNIIEKQGDLELNSTLELSLVFSYLLEEDIHLDIGRDELIGFGVKKLIRLAQKKLPTAVSDAASVRIARKWVTANLENWELLNALVYVYRRHHEVHSSLCTHMDREPARNIEPPTRYVRQRADATGPSYFKLRGLQGYRQHAQSVRNDRSNVPDSIKAVISDLSDSGPKVDSPELALEKFSAIARATFEHWGHHVPMLHLFDDKWNVLDLISIQFEDQADKYFFWRAVGEEVASLDAGAIIWISELWQRKASSFPSTPIRNLPIAGEALHVELMNRDGLYLVDGWNIKRDTDGNNPTLEGLSDVLEPDDKIIPNYLAPVARAMGGVAEKTFNDMLDDSKHDAYWSNKPAT